MMAKCWADCKLRWLNGRPHNESAPLHRQPSGRPNSITKSRLEQAKERLGMGEARDLAEPLEVQDASGHLIEPETPVERHERVDEQFTAPGPLVAVVVAEPALDRGED